MKYRTIVADPPWPVSDSGGPRTSGTKNEWDIRGGGRRFPVPYARMPIEEIAALPISDLADLDGCHLYLWTINAYLVEAYAVVRAWGFKPSTLLTWCKAPRGLGLGGAYTITTEYVLFARRGRLAPLRRWDTTWFQWPRPFVNGLQRHSRKPEAFYDLVEVVSPAPYLELFSRNHHRLGWDVWGNESANTASLETA